MNTTPGARTHISLPLHMVLELAGLAITVMAVAFFTTTPKTSPPTDPGERAEWHLRKAQEHIEAAERALRERRRNQLPTRREIVA